jgi:hypothetical protein
MGAGALRDVAMRARSFYFCRLIFNNKNTQTGDPPFSGGCVLPWERTDLLGVVGLALGEEVLEEAAAPLPCGRVGGLEGFEELPRDVLHPAVLDRGGEEARGVVQCVPELAALGVVVHRPRVQ